MDLLMNSKLKIEAEMILPICFDFVHKAKSKRLYVQYVTKNQCLNFLENRNESIIITDSNVESYQRYLEDTEGCAIVPHHLINSNDQTIASVADEQHNYTRFLILSSKTESPHLYQKNKFFKVSLIITPYIDRPGLLFDILKLFAEENVNLISIMSRPTKKQLGTYHFFIELVSDISSQNHVEAVLKQMKNHFEVMILGTYQEID